jgi:hypothetical protein
VVPHVLIAVRDHGTTPIPASLSNYVHLSSQERVGVANNGSDVEIVLPVLNRYVESVPAAIEIGNYRIIRPVAILVDNVAAVTVSQQVSVEPRVIGPGFRMRSDADFVVCHLRQVRGGSQPPRHATLVIRELMVLHHRSVVGSQPSSLVVGFRLAYRSFRAVPFHRLLRHH